MSNSTTNIWHLGRSFPPASTDFFVADSMLRVSNARGDMVPLAEGHRRALFSRLSFVPGEILCYMVGTVRSNEDFNERDLEGRGGFALALGDGANVFDCWEAVENRICLGSMANSPFRAYDMVSERAAVANAEYEVMIHPDGEEGVCITATLPGVPGCEVLVDYNVGGDTLYGDNNTVLTPGVGGRGGAARGAPGGPLGRLGDAGRGGRGASRG
ncbi:hypothetical protein B484DRAFT_437922 [Ochromonadaceae sp. CCMP2298]|nr:hypothetical protein B484DRAFT_437922 [Ochromonadaceae sp. CCMP2298]